MEGKEFPHTLRPFLTKAVRATRKVLLLTLSGPHGTVNYAWSEKTGKLEVEDILEWAHGL